MASCLAELVALEFGNSWATRSGRLLSRHTTWNDYNTPSSHNHTSHMQSASVSFQSLHCQLDLHCQSKDTSGVKGCTDRSLSRIHVDIRCLRPLDWIAFGQNNNIAPMYTLVNAWSLPGKLLANLHIPFVLGEEYADGFFINTSSEVRDDKTT